MGDAAGSQMWDVLWSALALMLVFEGLLPMVNPAGWRRVFEKALSLTDGQIRFIGVCSVLGGALVLALS